MHVIWYIMVNEQQKEWVIFNVERFIMKFGLIYIEKRTMICLHFFEDDVFMWNELLSYCGPLGSDDLISNNIYKTKGFNCH